MAGDEPDTLREHRRSPDDGAEEGSKHWKHSHHRHRHSSDNSSHRRHRHCHRSSKRDHERIHEEEEVAPPILSSSNSRPDDKKEGEILEEEEERVVGDEGISKRKADSDVESSEIKPMKSSIDRIIEIWGFMVRETLFLVNLGKNLSKILIFYLMMV